MDYGAIGVINEQSRGKQYDSHVGKPGKYMMGERAGACGDETGAQSEEKHKKRKIAELFLLFERTDVYPRTSEIYWN